LSLRVIAVIQLVFGLVFLLPGPPVADLLGSRPAAPGWANWLLTMMAARFLGYAAGMFVAARAPRWPAPAGIAAATISILLGDGWTPSTPPGAGWHRYRHESPGT
jgi:hypothetical protein